MKKQKVISINYQYFMNKIIGMIFGICFLMINFLFSHWIIQEVDPFYLQRLENGEQAYMEHNYKKAIEELEVALFGIQEKKQLKAKAFIYLGLSHFYLNDDEKARTYLKGAKDILGMDGMRDAVPDDSVWFYLQSSMIALELLEPETEQSTETDIISFDQLDSQPILKERVEPIYAPFAERLGIKGQVVVDALISEKGDVIEVKVVQKLPGGLTEEAVKAVSQWKYVPAMKNDQAVKVWKRITVTFKAPQAKNRRSMSVDKISG